jgi:ribokinase
MPKVGETVKGSSFEKNYGGKGANQAVQCQRLGVATAFIGKVGSDAYGSEYMTHFSEEGISSKCFGREDGSNSGIAVIWVDSKGHNSIIIVPGANLHIDASQIGKQLSYFPNMKVAVFQNEINESATISGLNLAKSMGVRSVFNPAPVSKSCQEMLPFCDILCVNELELFALAEIEFSTDELWIQKAARDLLTFGCNEIIITFGGKGAYLVNKVEFAHFPAPLVTRVVDTVGAGDSFIG